jgi:hypothetical protein
VIDRDKIRGRALCKRVLARLPAAGEARDLFNAALAGTGSGHDALADAPRDMWGLIVVALYYSGVAPDALRPLLRLAWRDRWLDFIQAARAEGNCLIPTFRYAAFPLPEGLPAEVTVWRGMRGAGVQETVKGFSWTMDRDAACAIAMVLYRASRSQGRPLVVRRTVQRERIVYYDPASETQDYSEVLFDAPPAGDVDGDEADWRAAADRWVERNRDWRRVA